MALKIGRYLIFLSVLFLLQLMREGSAEETVIVATSAEDDDSSSEETVEDTVESGDADDHRRRRRFLTQMDSDEQKAIDPRVSIPGLPNPATIIKVAEILQTVGEKIVPILIEGMPGDISVGDRIARDLKFLRNFKKEINLFSNDLRPL